MKIAIMGFGTVGSGAYEASRAAGDIEVVRILARHGREGYEFLDDIITPDIDDIAGDPEIELVVESMGGVEPAREYVLKCLRAGKHVVTPNKNLISACYSELMQEAAANGVKLRFTSAVGGGIPWLFNLLRTKRCDEILSIRGIVNGTCNYILDAMYDKGADFGEMLKIAQEIGYAEADPSADIEGTDTLRKTVISTNLAFDAAIKEEDVTCYGIDTIQACDIAYLKKKGLVCKLMMKAEKKNGAIEVYVEPTAFPEDSLEANVKLNNNLITLTARHLGTQSYFGQGAGMMPTGESVIQDVIDIRDGREQNIGINDASELKADNSNAVHRYYIRHDRMCEHMEPLVDTYEEKDGIYYCISKPLPVEKMHEMGHHRKEKGKEMFFAALAE
ncbi:MAG: homoserine dehydrogenase [Mogibacterium sp.]|nr:homoserine dehydrogenase [Mogibacterium sp.]MBR4089882.1 homoserine dehydrogenase [Mogibacterium sp.]